MKHPRIRVKAIAIPFTYEDAREIAHEATEALAKLGFRVTVELEVEPDVSTPPASRE